MTLEDKICLALSNAKKKHDQRFLGNKDEARGTEATGIIHKCIAVELNDRLPHDKKGKFWIISNNYPYEYADGKFDEAGKELTFPAKRIRSKRADISVAKRNYKLSPNGKIVKKDGKSVYAYSPVAAILSKCIFQNFSQNDKNYTQTEGYEVLAMRRKGYPVGTIFCPHRVCPYYYKDGSYKCDQFFGREQIVAMLEEYECDPDKYIERPNAMLVFPFDVDNNGNITKSSPINLGLNAISDTKLIDLYQKISDPNRFYSDFLMCLPQDDSQIV